MRFTRINTFICMLFAITLFSCNREDEDKHCFDNKLFMDVENPIEELLFKEGDDVITETREIILKTALVAENEITAKIKKSPLLVEEYNRIYQVDAQVLPDEMCIIENENACIKEGGTSSLPVIVTFKNLEKLDPDVMYVMPVEVVDVMGIDLLSSKTKKYFLFKGASLINVVADIKENYLPVTWSEPDKVNDLKILTIEALINVRDFGTVNGVKGESISSLFGIEGYFLLRFGDSGFTENQLQVVSPDGTKFPENNPNFGLPSNKWVHVAFVWDSETKERIIYTDGKEIVRDENASGTIDLAYGDCYIGKSFNDERWLDGCISELRIWSTHRSQEDLIANIYELDPASENLIAYWKFNEGVGKIVKDYSGNGNDVTAVKDLIWTKVNLPEKDKNNNK